MCKELLTEALETIQEKLKRNKHNLPKNCQNCCHITIALPGTYKVILKELKQQLSEHLSNYLALENRFNFEKGESEEKIIVRIKYKDIEEVEKFLLLDFQEEKKDHKKEI